MPKALSATVPAPLMARARAIARLENRSLSNVVENALGVFTAMPKELRDLLVERLAAGGADDPILSQACREMMFALARHRYEAARKKMVEQIWRSGADKPANSDDWEVIAEPAGR